MSAIIQKAVRLGLQCLCLCPLLWLLEKGSRFGLYILLQYIEKGGRDKSKSSYVHLLIKKQANSLFIERFVLFTFRLWIHRGDSACIKKSMVSRVALDFDIFQCRKCILIF